MDMKNNKEIKEDERMDSNNILYFAYGSNMNIGQMHERCPGNRFIGKAHLEGFKFVFDGHSDKRQGSVANVIQSAENNVEGGLFAITESDLKTLDKSEGYPSVYNRAELTVKDEKGNSFHALVYKRIGERTGKPSKSYLNTILKGAENCHLSERYIKEFLKE